MSRSPSRVFWILVVAFLLITRVPVAAGFLSIDNVNLAYALDHFDPRLHQPQPPGYPLFVLFAKILNVIFRDPWVTFLVISVLVSTLCLPVIYALGEFMFDAWVGEAAVWLLVLNPVFWHTALDGPLRPNLALFALLTAYCAWRAWNGESRFVFWGALALGVGAGFRPDLLAYLGPLWLVSIVVGTRSVRTLVLGSVVLGAVVLTWVCGLAYAVGGFASLYHLLENYLVVQSQPESVVLGASRAGWLHQVSRLVIWNGLSILAWIWAVPLFLVARERIKLLSRHVVFLMVWIVPGVVAQALIHVAAPGHTAFATPALCLAGAYVLRAALRRWNAETAGLAIAGAASVMFFLNFVALPPTESTGGIRDAFAYGTFETSLGSIRWVDDIYRSSMNEIRAFRTPDRHTVVIAQDRQPKNWFFHWRIARYYLTDVDLLVAADQKSPAETMTVRGEVVSPPQSGSPVEIPVPPHSRILWVVEGEGPLHQALAKAGVIHGGPHVFYTDIDEGSMPFQVLDFRIVPKPAAENSHSGVQ